MKSTELDKRMVQAIEERELATRSDGPAATEMHLTMYSRILFSLSEAHRDAVFLCHLGFGIDEIARHVKKSETWVSNTLKKTIKRVDGVSSLLQRRLGNSTYDWRRQTPQF